MVQATLYLLQYNNYYNRIVKQEQSLSDYLEYQVGVPIERVNFIPNDGINTTQIINWNYSDPDYLVVTDEDGNINSRWFVVDSTRTRAGQYQITLHRDVLVDYREAVDNSTAYIKRANITNDNPLIYNSEQMNFNQIKTSETLLKDKTNSAWIVGYLASSFTQQKNISVSLGNEPAPLTNYEELLDYSSKNQKVLVGIPTLIFTTLTNPGSPTYRTYTVTPGNSATVASTTDSMKWAGIQQTANKNLTQEVTDNFLNRGEQLKSALANYVTNLSLDNTYIAYNGRVVRSTDGRYFKVSVTQVNNQSNVTENVRTGSASNSLYSTIQDMVTATDGIQYRSGYDPFHQWCKILYSYTEWQLVLTEITYGDLTLDIPTSKQALSDAPYFMFGMKYTDGNLKLAIEIARELTSANVYDIQVLPYCPALEYYSSTGELQTALLTKDVQYSEITNGSTGDVVDYIVWCQKSSFTFDIPYEITVDDIKISNECDKYRLCSPNGNGTFELNVAKNGGVRNINVDCTYMPIDPYIHLNPDFSNLYGRDFNDFRGLILQGDFSLPMINDKWQEYQVQNKNYQNIFNREIRNLEVTQSVQRLQDIFGGIVGTAQGAGMGAVTGSIFGPIGTAIGGAAGGLLSAAGAVGDYLLNEKLRNEQRSYKEDMFRMSLENIQALPYSISKTTPLVNNNKLFPYIEYYTCTDIEKQVLKDKLKWQGMTVGAVGVINQYNTVYNESGWAYVESDLIDIPIDYGYSNSYNVSMAISRELNMGVRFTPINIT